MHSKMRRRSIAILIFIVSMTNYDVPSFGKHYLINGQLACLVPGVIVVSQHFSFLHLLDIAT